MKRDRENYGTILYADQCARLRRLADAHRRPAAGILREALDLGLAKWEADRAEEDRLRRERAAAEAPPARWAGTLGEHEDGPFLGWLRRTFPEAVDDG